MKSEIPKQFLLLDGEPVLIKTLRKFLEAIPDLLLIVVLPEKHLANWLVLQEDYPFISDIKVAKGGHTRSDSVRAGLNEIVGQGLVAIHDAVRPFVEADTIRECFTSAEKNGSGVAAVPLKDSIREIREDGNSVSRDRDHFVLVQTPQTFLVEKIKEAYEVIGEGSFSDDATVFEKAGNTIYLVEGSYSNIKITTPEDLSLGDPLRAVR